ncbi:glycosyltransferase [Pelagicoccus albus]|uniref:Glycosyltransferase n=1 Tax=Pelagicoccus albus TaxID=415222 RepID=A0A7X1B9Q1_9BACT|nr:glycosyltransferase [Pelagicoccus albus]MBC2608249.1 glycosyltransferase [Pelagicoccus albus]
MRKILFISYHFPPQGGAGVQRSLKFAKYLPSFGVQPYILTSDKLVESRWTPKDDSMMKELPEGIAVTRAPWSHEIGSSKWKKLRDEAIKLVQEQELSAILVTMSPFEDAALAEAISKATNIPWIADLRDPWALDEFQSYRSGFHRSKERKKMESALAGASSIIMNTPVAAKALQNAYPSFSDKKIYCVTNGFDSEDINRDPDAPSEIEKKKFNIVHTGTFHTELGQRQQKRKVLNTLLSRHAKGVEFLPRSPFYLFQALSKIKADRPEVYEKLNIVFAGVSGQAEKDLTQAFGLEDSVTQIGYVSHDQSVGYLHYADLLFLPLHHIPSGNNASIVPGKTYEYLASGKPILGALPQGDAREFVANYSKGTVCDPKDVQAMYNCILAEYEKWLSKADTRVADSQYLTQFERRTLTENLSKIIEATVSAS